MKLEEAINKYSEKKIDEIINQFQASDKVATGKLNKSLRYTLESDTESMKHLITFYGEEYIHYVAGGRNPGKLPNLDNLEEWMAARGISKDKLFAIATKIKQDGIPADATIQQIFENEYYTDFAGILTFEGQKEIQSQVDEIIKSFNNKQSLK